jgi:hypothetical protein
VGQRAETGAPAQRLEEDVLQHIGGSANCAQMAANAS